MYNVPPIVFLGVDSNYGAKDDNNAWEGKQISPAICSHHQVMGNSSTYTYPKKKK